MMMRFIFVHGSWMNEKCWAPVRSLLEAQGCETVAVNLPGHGHDETPLSALTFASYTDAVRAALTSPSVLVGHSMAGTVISQVAELAPKRIQSLIYVAAYLLKSGQTLNELAQSDADSGVGPAMRPAPDWSTLDLDEPSRSPLFFHDVDPLVAEPFLAQWRAEPVAPLGTPIQLGDAYAGVPRWYVRTELDRVISPSMQAQMLEATPCKQRSLPTGHLPMLAQPKALADILLEATK
ncbi:MAG: alpha/beta hydrolase [Armatimonadetes bacterium]|nr:alpha/beta hydrolase [Armatimonadota bacterium]